MNDCIFCKIIAGEIPSDKVYEDDAAIVFRDVNPQSPSHLLVVPKKHMKDIAECERCDHGLLGELFAIVARVAVEEGLAQGGFRVVTNCGKDACQSVDHFHIHVLGGKQLSPWLG